MPLGTWNRDNFYPSAQVIGRQRAMARSAEAGEAQHTLKRPFLWASLLGKSPLSLGGREAPASFMPSVDICRGTHNL